MANLNASIDFGLVHIPVEIITAEDRTEHISFHLLDARDNARIRQKRVNEDTGREVEWEDIVKGFEVSKGRYVTFTEDEIKALETESNKSLAIDAFIDREEIPPEMFETPYYVLPSKGGERGWAILREVLEKSEKFAVVQSVLRTREQLGVLYAHDNAMMYGILRYPDELKKPSEVIPSSLNRIKVAPREVAMAEKLLDEMTSKFHPSAYKDDYVKKLHEAIKRKTSKGKAKTAPHPKERERPSKSMDIMELLERSLGNSKRATGQKTTAKRRKAA